MPREDCILVAVDDSEASRRAVRYVGRFLGARKGYRVILLNVIRPVPQKLLEHGGRSDPDAERRASRRLEDRQEQWVAEAGEAAQPLLEDMSRDLVDAGLPKEAVESSWHAPIPEDSLAQALLNAANDLGCGTIVVGRDSLPWYRDLMKGHVADELLEKGEDLAVWVVQ